MYEIFKTLVLSTAHITNETAVLGDSGSIPLPTLQREYGFMVWVPTDENHVLAEDEVIPQDLVPALELAKKLDCQWVMFDSDGPEVKGLPVFEWAK